MYLILSITSKISIEIKEFYYLLFSSIETNKISLSLLKQITLG